jgi:hypothetical protein
MITANQASINFLFKLLEFCSFLCCCHNLDFFMAFALLTCGGALSIEIDEKTYSVESISSYND